MYADLHLRWVFLCEDKAPVQAEQSSTKACGLEAPRLSALLVGKTEMWFDKKLVFKE